MRMKPGLFWLTAPLFLLAVMTGMGFLMVIRPTLGHGQRATATWVKE